MQTYKVSKLINSTMVLVLTILCCDQSKPPLQRRSKTHLQTSNRYVSVGDIPVPRGYERAVVAEASFGEWLRKIKLKSDSRIFLYNGQPRGNQSTHFAVLDMPVGEKDLQQCADAILRLRTEYFFSHHYLDSIHFRATDGTELSFAKWLKGERYQQKENHLVPYHINVSTNNQRMQLEKFLEVVFNFYGTMSLSKDTKPVKEFNDLGIGDIFIRAGSPGHAMIVLDVAVNSDGQKIFMLAQGLMPAQSIHIVKNPMDYKMSPWYKVNANHQVSTPDWVFYCNQIHRW